MEHLHLRITQVRKETPQATSYFVEQVDGEPLRYQAGQFLTVIVQLNGKEERRSYSIGATPGVDAQAFFTIKRLENGAVSRYLSNHLIVGDIITTLPPTGRFSIKESSSLPIVFIAAGSGITPVFSLLKKAWHEHLSPKVVLLYQNTTEADAIFLNELIDLQQQHSNSFLLEAIFSNPDNDALPHRRLNNSLLERLLQQYIGNAAAARYYLCGPETFMRMAQFTLKALGVADEYILREHFYAAPPPPPKVLDARPHQLHIRYRGQQYNITVTWPQTILEAALQHHIHLPYSCRGGRCSTCTARCISGKVTMSINDVLTPKDLANGLILTCVAYAESDVEIEL